MLQQIRDGLGRWVFGLIIGLIAISFVFWGIDFNIGTPTFAAKVNGEKIPLVDFQRDYQQQQNIYQQQTRSELTDPIREELRRSVVDRLVSIEALHQRAEKSGFRVSDERLTDFLQSIPQFQIDGEFSMDAYRAYLVNQGLAPSQFEEQQRQRLGIEDLRDGLAQSAFYTPAEFRRYIELVNQRRQVGYALFEASSFVDAVEVSEPEVETYYSENGAEFQTEESVDLEYVRLRLEDVAANVSVTEEDLIGYYEQVAERFVTEEQRKARHILFAGPGEESTAKAQAALERLAAGEDFAALAAELSDDGGTKNRGGDLGWVIRGQMVGPFENALFAMEEGAIEGPVQTQFGAHIIQFDELRAGTQRSFDEVRDELIAEFQTNRAEDEYYDRANRLADEAFENLNTLAPVAEALGLELQTLPGFTAQGGYEVFPASEPIALAAFSPQVLIDGENSPLVTLSEGDVVVLRVSQHYPPQPKPLEEVAEEIRGIMQLERAQERAAEAGETFRSRIESGDDAASVAENLNGTWSEETWWTRSDAGSAPIRLRQLAFQAPTSEAASIDSAATATGDYGVVRVTAVEPGSPSAIPRAERDNRKLQLASQAGLLELSAYVEGVRDNAKVQIPPDVLTQDF